MYLEFTMPGFTRNYSFMVGVAYQELPNKFQFWLSRTPMNSRKPARITVNPNAVRGMVSLVRSRDSTVVYRQFTASYAFAM